MQIAARRQSAADTCVRASDPGSEADKKILGGEVGLLVRTMRRGDRPGIYLRALHWHAMADSNELDEGKKSFG